MNLLSRRIILAIAAVADIATHQAECDAVKSKDITRRLQTRRRAVEIQLQDLVAAKVLSSVRGPLGGYRLAKPARETLLSRIVEVIAETSNAADLELNSPGVKCITPVIQSLSKPFIAGLKEWSIADLRFPAQKAAA